MSSQDRNQAPAKPKRRPGGRSRRVRAATIAATLAELAEGGYAGLSLERIARRAGVNPTSLYRRWGNRERLVLEAMLEQVAQHVSVPDTGSLRDDLLELARNAAANAARPEVAAMARAVAAQAPYDAELAAANEAFWAERLALDGAIVKRAIERGEIDGSTDPTQVIESVIGPIHLRLLLTGQPLGDKFLKRTVDTVINGVRPRPKADQAAMGTRS
jgi:AcrR family transcriptional regulator